MSASAPMHRPRALTLLERPTVRGRRKASLVRTPDEVRARSIRRRVFLVWSLLFLNVLTFYVATWNGEPLLVPIPHRLGQLITQGSLPVALAVALTINRRLFIRPNVFMWLLSLLVVEAVFAALVQGSGHTLGTVYRTVRLAGFVCTLWLLTPWWGRRDMMLLKAHLLPLALVLGSVLLGLIVAPGRALAGHRLSGILWPMPPTEVADFAATTIGLVVVLWFCGLASMRVTWVVVPLVGLILILTHARTELLGMTTGIVVTGLSLFAVNSRVRRFFARSLVALSVVIMTLSGFLETWLVRGEKRDQLSTFTGRTQVWGPLLAFRRDKLHQLVGFGLSNKSFNGLPIDSNWLAAYWDLGLIGVAICAALLLLIPVNAYFQSSQPGRALALFIAIYLMVRSFIETGLTDASANMLLLFLAASFVAPPVPPAARLPASAGQPPARRRHPAPPDTVGHPSSNLGFQSENR